MNDRRSPVRALLAILTSALACAAARAQEAGGASIAERYEKSEHMVPMRDGVRLFTAVYAPVDRSRSWPILMRRTPYSVRPYGEDRFPESLGPSPHFADAGYIFVYQDVRGKYMSEGEFENMRPHDAHKQSPEEIDESSDTFDTIQWLVDALPNDNGRAGMWGISYPGFYAAAGMIDAHPALAAVSPQAPIADWYFDDFHHHGAFFLPHAFNFLASFGLPRPAPTTEGNPRFDHGTPDGYAFFLELGPLKNADERHFKGQVAFWNEIAAHPDYDDFWQARDLLPHLHRVAPAVMTVGGWFDAEDLYGPLQIYRSVEAKNPGVFNVLVMGPWRHGGWARDDGSRLGNVAFGAPTAEFYRGEVELPFFEHFLKGEGEHGLPEALLFETGANRWRRFEAWPPRALEEKSLHLIAGGGLSLEPATAEGFDEYVSDPAKPVPFTEAITVRMTVEYMTDDQRFAARRPDVLVYQTPPLSEDVTLAGPILADLWVSTSGEDSDWVVKLVDVYPPDAPDHEHLSRGQHMGNYHMMVRSEIIRGRYRESYEHPVPFKPNEPTNVRLPLQDVLHTFRAGHRIQVQIQSTWFPLVDRNPQTWVDNIFEAEESDFVKATQRVHAGGKRGSRLVVGVLPPP